MTSPCNHKQTIISAPHQGFQINPLSSGLERSPCLCHPLTGKPCVRVRKDKNHPACENCAVFKRGKADCWNPELYKAPPKIITDNRIKDCLYPGCKRTTKGGYCKRHKNVMCARRKRWRELHGDEPIDLKWLHRPISIEMSKRGQGRSKNKGVL